MPDLRIPALPQLNHKTFRSSERDQIISQAIGIFTPFNFYVIDSIAPFLLGGKSV